MGEGRLVIFGVADRRRRRDVSFIDDARLFSRFNVHRQHALLGHVNVVVIRVVRIVVVVIVVVPVSGKVSGSPRGGIRNVF